MRELRPAEHFRSILAGHFYPLQRCGIPESSRLRCGSNVPTDAADMPELGRVTAGEVAAITGFAPVQTTAQ